MNPDEIDKEEIVLDLQKLAEQFLRANPQWFEKDILGDAPAIQAMSATGGDRAGREKNLLAWLHGYSVLRSFTPGINQKIVEQIIAYADNREQTTLNQDKDLIIQEYGKLERLIHQVVPLNPKSRKPREITSLTSKALWCCYPGDIPILDGYAERALQVISRICNLVPATDQSRFAAFIDVWFQVYISKSHPSLIRPVSAASRTRSECSIGFCGILGNQVLINASTDDSE